MIGKMTVVKSQRRQIQQLPMFLLTGVEIQLVGSLVLDGWFVITSQGVSNIAARLCTCHFVSCGVSHGLFGAGRVVVLGRLGGGRGEGQGGGGRSPSSPTFLLKLHRSLNKLGLSSPGPANFAGLSRRVGVTDSREPCVPEPVFSTAHHCHRKCKGQRVQPCSECHRTGRGLLRELYLEEQDVHELVCSVCSKSEELRRGCLRQNIGASEQDFNPICPFGVAAFSL